MKKIFLVAVCAVFALTASAQRASSSSSSFFSTEKSDQPITWGVRGGLNLATMTGSDADDLDSRVGFNIGVSVDIPLMQSLYLQSGLYYTQKGFKFTENGYDDEKIEATVTPSYLEIPFLASYRYDINDNLQLQVNAGPYIAYGIGGKWKEEYKYDGEKEEDEIDFFGDGDDEAGGKRFDFGYQVGAGLTISKHFFVGIAYEHGFAKAIKDVKVNNSNFMINVGYNF